MAAIIMLTLGEPQTCDGPCEHRDCAYWRRIVGKACVLCTEPVESGQRFHFHGGEHDVVHALCYEEHDRATRPLPKVLAREWLEGEIAHLNTEVAKEEAEIAALEALKGQVDS